MQKLFTEMEQGMILNFKKLEYVADDLQPHKDMRLAIRTGEEWRQIKGTACYFVSSHGRVAVVERYAIMNNQTRKYKAKILKQSKSKDEYLQVNIGEGMGLQLVHRLVYEAFNGKIDDNKEIDHINNKRDDNRLENLQQLTHKENILKKFI